MCPPCSALSPCSFSPPCRSSCSTLSITAAVASGPSRFWRKCALCATKSPSREDLSPSFNRILSDRSEDANGVSCRGMELKKMAQSAAGRSLSSFPIRAHFGPCFLYASSSLCKSLSVHRGPGLSSSWHVWLMMPRDSRNWKMRRMSVACPGMRRRNSLTCNLGGHLSGLSEENRDWRSCLSALPFDLPPFVTLDLLFPPALDRVRASTSSPPSSSPRSLLMLWEK
mmetsp:Transcript_15696/g.52537  ORF Transcript_15696/g.52537 Transcript_15696/m.52537 type:complete len:226 (-) Transcript_15696:1390-2067(-)